MFDNVALRGLFSLMGAFLISLAVGINYLWGIIIIYATSYFRIAMKDDTLTEDQTDIVFPLMLLGQALAIPFVTRYAKKVSSGMTCFVAGIAMSFIMYMSSYIENFANFAVFYGFGSGVVLGIIYIIPIGHCYQFFPRKKSTISFFIISASGVGTLIFTFIALDCMNPKNLTLSQSGSNFFYGRQIAMKFPQFLRIMSGVMLGFISGGGLLLFQYPTKFQTILKQEMLASEKKNKDMGNLMNLEFVLTMDQPVEVMKNPFGNQEYQFSDLGRSYDKNQIAKVYGQTGDNMFWEPLDESFASNYQPPKDDEDQQAQKNKEQAAKIQAQNEFVNQCPRTSDGPRQFIFWLIFVIIVLGANFGQMISVNYKTYMKVQFTDDRYLSMIGACGAIACSLSRLIWGSVLDKDTFKSIYYCLAILNCALAFTIIYFSHIKQAYFIYVLLSYIVYGGHLGIFPAVASKVFGIRYGPQIYGILYFAFPVSNFIQYLLINYINQSYEVIFQVSGAMSIGALLLVKKLQLAYDWSARIREHNQRKRMLAR